MRHPFAAMAIAAEGLFSRRGLALILCLAAAGLVWNGGLRPPLSPDIPSYAASAAAGSPRSPAGAELPNEHAFTFGSIGSALLLIIAAGALLILWRPGSVGTVSGVFLSTTLAGGIAIAVNQPGLVELMDVELEQRQHMVTMIAALSVDSLTNHSNGRVNAAPVDGLELAEITRGFLYLKGFPLLWGLACVGIIFGYRDRLGSRLGRLVGWGAFGVVLACVVCFSRIFAEANWLQARRFEAQGRAVEAERAIERAVSAFPELDRLQRTWYLRGKLDYRAGHSTAAEQFFRADQFARNAETAIALGLMRALQVEYQNEEPAIRRQHARILATSGLHHFRGGRFAAARDAWRRAAQIDSDRIDCSVFLGLVQVVIDSQHPERVERQFAALSGRIADRAIRADLLATLGDAYFDAGRVAEARRWYARSLAVFSLPKTINYRAQKGLTGM